MVRNVMTQRDQRHGEAWLLAGGLLVAGGLFYRVAGGPRLPTALPDGDTVLATLTGTTIPYGALGAFCTMVAWALWLWLTGTLMLQLVLAAAEAVTCGARWVRSLRVVLDPLTLPAVRRLAHGTAIAFTVAQLATRAAPAASASAAVPVPVVAAVSMSSQASNSHAQPDTTRTYTVQPGDNLWALAERFYGDGEQWPKIVVANVGRRMPDGAVFPRNPVLQPGWVLQIPDAPPATAAAPHVTYVVRTGDTLSVIAQRFYGDATAWPRILAANRGAHLANGWTLSDPNLIWPGLALTIPDVAPPPVPAAPSSPAPKATAPHVAHAATSATAVPPRSVRTTLAKPPTGPASQAPTPHPASPTPVAPPTPERAPLAAPQVAHVTAVPSVVPTAAPAVTPAAQPRPGVTPAGSLVPAPALGLAALAAIGAGGTILLARHQRRRPGMPGDRDAGIPVRDGYGDPAHAPTFAHRLYGGGEPALLVAEQVQHVLVEQHLDAARIIAVREGRHTMTLTLDGSLTVRRRLLELEAPLAEALAARVKMRPTADNDVTSHLSRLGQLRLVTPPSDDAVPPLPLVAVGILPTREAFHVNWNAVSNMLIVGTPAEATNTVLTSALTALTARRHPDALRLWLVASRDSLPPTLGALPHLARPVVEPRNTADLRAMLDDLVAELDRRADGTTGRESEHLLVLQELGDVPGDDLLPLLERGPAHEVHVLAATVRPEAVSDALVSAIGTVLALRLPNEEQGVRLVGTPDASTLDDGELLVRLEGRVPVRMRAFKVEHRYLERLIEHMRAAYGRATPDQPAAEETPQPNTEAAATAEAVVDAAHERVTDGPPVGDENAVAEDVKGEVTGSSAVEEAVTRPSVSAVADPATTGDPTSAPRVVPAGPGATGVPLPAMAAVPDTPSQNTPLLFVRCFGSLQVCSGERDISCMHQYQAWELLAYLVTHGGSVTRQEVFDTFWPQVEGAVVGNRLDRLVFRLKKVLTAQVGEGARDILSREQGKLALDEAVLTSDLQRFKALLNGLPKLPPEQVVTALEAALALAGDELLAGADYSWLEQPGEDGLTLRERYQERVARVMHDLACRYRDRGDAERAVELFRKVLDAQPTLQPTARGLYRCFAVLKDPDGLQQSHAQLVAALRRERAAAGTEGEAFRLQPKTLAVYQRSLEEAQGAAAQEHEGIG